MRGLALLSLFLLCGCSNHFACRQNAYAQNAHPNLGLGTIISDAIDPPKPHAPLNEMLAECDK